MRQGDDRRHRGGPILVGLALACVAVQARGADGVAGPRVTIDGAGDPGAGHVTVTWSTAEPAGARPSFQLEESASASFEPASIRYEGPHESSVVSGLPDGTLHFRARARIGDGPWGPWSEPFPFETRHHSLTLAGSLFAVGAVAFGLTAAFVVTGARRSSEEDGRG